MPLEKATILAKCEKCDRSEETQIDAEGNFRLRGLMPNNKYSLHVSSDLIERTVPNVITIDMKN